jgi:hypothetical protein
VFTEIGNLRCADCGTDDILLQGQAKWDGELKRWIIPKMAMDETEGEFSPADDTANFFCRACGNTCPVRMGY